VDTFDIRRDMEVIHNFVDTGVYKRDRSLINTGLAEEGKKVISHISNFRPVKKISSIIKVFCNVSRKVDCRLLLAGDGPEMSTIREMVDRLDLTGKVVFLGRQEDVVPLLNISDIYMLPSKSESFGLSALEAMSCGVPVIGTSEGGLREVVEDGVSGYICHPNDIEGMSREAISILTGKNRREKMGRAARKRALDFDSSIIIDRYIDYYNKILSG